MRVTLSQRPSWSDLRRRLVEALPAAFPHVGFAISSEDANPEVAWFEGPAESSVAAVVGDTPGWTVESALLGPDPDAPAGRAALRLTRSFADRTWALAAVRYQAAGTRPFERARPRALETLWAILEEDDPSGRWPLAEAITDLLVAAPEPPGAPLGGGGGGGPDYWAWKLSAVGYDRLWSTAWTTVDL